MSRVVTLDPATLSDRQREVYEAIASGPRGGVRGPLAVWLERPELADHAQALGRYCRYDSSLPPRLSELAILVTARHWSAEYEWQAHKPHALKAGLSLAIVEAIRDGAEPPFEAEDEAATYAFATALLATKRVPEPVWTRAVAALGREGVVDLTGVLGYYGLISMTITAFEVPAPDPAAPEM
ncbi:carboxymuconolactone decarboxylase family protein [Acuticoccus mangrovi]|uniref:Carboxymuconolactone decarboxylase family protein n=1 Tax=Acuticoccus mangrovi TaxID=2796142 RepID=A0A934MNB4_9HYPH|nr:carboxymuconolactone decarboxylase family protein [Acuticoccus mangrovi]MBJ3778034.1 carboxymuconolactone decarboxylase family protein [Acuticoccus mangrovi]